MDRALNDFSGPWPAPAKLNLMLRIVGRRVNGYHELQTVFQFMDRADQLFFRLRNDAAVRHLNPLEGVPEEHDLCVRAARLLQREVGCLNGVDIRIDKQLPMGGGLGGGSSDAATTLIVLNRLWGINLDQDRLADMGLSLGADVPVFVRGRAAWAEGVGEHLRFLELPEPWYLVLIPDCHVSTAAVFSAPELTRNSPRITILDFLAGSRVNDCLPVVRKMHLQVECALAWLARHGRGQLTGTGACVFAEYGSAAEACTVLQEVPDEFQAFVARGVNRSPVLDRLGTDERQEDANHP